MGIFFGTDGIRGVANEAPMVPETIIKIGMAIASILGTNSSAVKVIVGRDTRISSDMIESALAAGFCSMGASVVLTGVMPTPAIALLTKSQSLSAGIVISASHNPFADNGIKIFLGDGNKPSTEMEAAIERLILSNTFPQQRCLPQDLGTIEYCPQNEASYRVFLKQAVSLANIKMRIVLDCANGATSVVAPRVFEELGFDVVVINNTPTGININDNCGSQHTQTLSAEVLTKKAACGFAFDGDGDRVIAVDGNGKTLTGDQLLTICGLALKKKGKLKNNIIVRTVMSNYAMTLALQQMGIDYRITDVGDKNVFVEMNNSGAVIGGEDSGHIIFSDFLTTGDGILTALHVLSVMQEENKPLSELASVMNVLPQVLLNVQTKQRTDFMSIHEIASVITKAETSLGSDGRVLVRYSGTQNLCRVMVEARSMTDATSMAQAIAKTIAKHLA